MSYLSRGIRSLSIAEATIDPVALDEIRMLGDGDGREFLAELIDQFALDTETRLVQLREAFEAGDATVVGDITHSLKGSSGQLGGRCLSTSCDRLERRALAGRVADGRTELEAVEIAYRDLRRALTQQLERAEERSESLHA